MSVLKGYQKGELLQIKKKRYEMRLRKITKRNYRKDNGQMERKPKEEEKVENTADPVKTKDGKGYTFKINNQDIIEDWLKVLTLRYWHHLQDKYTIIWNDITNKGGNIKLETEIQVVKQEFGVDIDENCANFKPAESNVIYHINLYHQSAKILIRGQFKEEWIEKEFVVLNKIIQIATKGDKSIIQYYNEEFEINIITDDNNQKRSKNKDEEKKEGVDEPNIIQKETDIRMIEETERLQYIKENNGKKDKVIDIIELEDFNTKEKIVEKKKSPKKSPKKKVLVKQQDEKNNEKTQNMEKVINQIDKELNYWVTTYKENNEKLELQIKTILEEVIQPIITEKQNLMKRVEELEETIEEQDQLIKDIKVQNNNDRKQMESSVKYEIIEIRKDIKNLITENGKIKDLMKVEVQHNKNLKSLIINNKKEEETMEKNEGKEEEHKEERQRNNINEERIQNKDTDEEKKRLSDSKSKRLVILMDSNRKFVEFNKLFPKKIIKIIPCGSTEVANNIINDKILDYDEILLHVGTNDLETKDPQVVAKDIANVTKNLKEKYRGKIFVSNIPIRKDHLHKNVDRTNILLKQELAVEIEHGEVKMIYHGNIRSNDNLYDRKHLSKYRNGMDLSGVEMLSLNLYNLIDGSMNGVKLLQSIRNERNRNTRGKNEFYGNKNVHQANGKSIFVRNQIYRTNGHYNNAGTNDDNNKNEGRRNNTTIGGRYNKRGYNEEINMNKSHHVSEKNRYDNFIPCDYFFGTLV